MKIRTSMIVAMILMLLTGSALAQMMSGDHMGDGSGHHNDPGSEWAHMGYGKGHGTGGVGGMGSMMYDNTISHGYLNNLNPIDTAAEAWTVIQSFISASNSSLLISELWEYGGFYKAELSDTNGAKAFDLIADKFTGAVMPEMGFSMMFNASYGKQLHRTPRFRKNLSVSPDEATVIAQTFVLNNGLGYTLGTPEIYPGYYKFHTTHGGLLGMDIMVNGYHGGIWMNTLYGIPVNRHN
jgi:hypothetical protein